MSSKSASLGANEAEDKASCSALDFSLKKHARPENKDSIIPAIIKSKPCAKNLKKLKTPPIIRANLLLQQGLVIMAF